MTVGFWVVLFYGIQGIALIVILLISWKKDRRVSQKDTGIVPPGFQATNEIMIDPVDQKKRQIYFNPTTGERFYKVIEEESS